MNDSSVGAGPLDGPGRSLDPWKLKRTMEAKTFRDFVFH